MSWLDIRSSITSFIVPSTSHIDFPWSFTVTSSCGNGGKGSEIADRLSMIFLRIRWRERMQDMSSEFYSVDNSDIHSFSGCAIRTYEGLFSTGSTLKKVRISMVWSVLIIIKTNVLETLTRELQHLKGRGQGCSRPEELRNSQKTYSMISFYNISPFRSFSHFHSVSYRHWRRISGCLWSGRPLSSIPFKLSFHWSTCLTHTRSPHFVTSPTLP